MSFRRIEPIHGKGLVHTDLPFSTAIRAGDFVFVSGMASVDETGKIVRNTFENEARRTYDNLRRVLAAADLTFANVVQVRVYLAEQKDWDEHNRIYREYFSAPYPARTTLIGCLGDLVKYEVDLIAYAGTTAS